MSMDYGRRKTRKMNTGVIVTFAIGILAVVAVVGSITLASHKNDSAKFAAAAQKYGVGGTPCPEATPAQVAANGPTPNQVTDYGGMHILRAFGDVECDEIVVKGRVKICLFSSPGTLEAQIGQQDLRFLPGLGRPASVMVDEDNKLSCVLAPKAAA